MSEGNVMNEGHDTDETATADQGGEFDLRAAAKLLEQSKREARRQFSFHRPLLTLFRAALILFAYGAVWWSVRGQHPYTGPSGTAIVELYAAVIVIVATTSVSFRRATRGISGRSRRQQKALGVAFGTAWIAVAVFQGALLHDGASKAIVYGVFPAAGQLVVVGACAAGMAAVQEDWQQLSLAVAVVALATGSSFAGPIWVWGVLAIGGCVIGIGAAAFQLRQRLIARA
jgi:hypothetical protein